MLNDFVAYKLAKIHYQICKRLKLPNYLKNQLLRSSSSVALTIAEGSGKRTLPDQQRYYSMALGSLRECQAAIELENINHDELLDIQDQLGAILFKLSGLSNSKPKTPTESSD
jgi:four helix bundle protein